MVQVLWLLGGAMAMHLWQRQKAAHPAATALAAPPTAPGQMTPARAAVLGDLVNNCCDPGKLRRAATLFGQEGLPQQAQALLRKAAMVHDMMHGAKAIVERCRAGDQHAMAMAKAIGEQARAGNKRAQISAFLIQQYTKDFPAEAKKAA
jgi:hypothetical protein